MNKKNSVIKDLLEVTISAALIAFLLTKLVLIPVVVEGSSMEPNLAENDRGFSFVISKNITVSRFDIVVVHIGKGHNIVKRVIGMPGETVCFRDNSLYIDGVYQDEPFLGDVNTGDFDITLKDDEYYCLGDNRDVSIDSRYYGPFTKEDFLSSHILVLYPFNRIGWH